MTVDVLSTTVCVPSNDVVARVIEDDIVIIPLTAGIGDADDELYTLNEGGRAIWELLDGQRTLGDVIKILMERFEAPQTELEADVLGFAADLSRRGILAIRV